MRSHKNKTSVHSACTRLYVAFAELRKATVSLVMSVLPSAMSNSASTERTFMKFHVSLFF